jgi:hypothetical protein
MYVTTLSFYRSTPYEKSDHLQFLSDVDSIINIEYQEIYSIYKSAVEENDIINTVLEVVKFNNDTLVFEEHFFSTAQENASNFLRKHEFIAQLYQDNGFTMTVQTQENVDFENYQSECVLAEEVVVSDFYTPVDLNIPYRLWDTDYPL